MSRPMLLAVTAIAAVAGALLGAPPALAADAPVTTTVAAGHDVSYPQCGSVLPVREDIAVVGVNAGTGTTTNPCLAQQLAWGDGFAPDGTPRTADVYVNTANPGHLGGWWPGTDAMRSGAGVRNPHGSCVGAENAACAYVYGYSIALDDALTRGVPRPQDRTWWLDVETTNSWGWDRSANRAVLEGMTDALHGIGARVGLYSTTRQWSLIVGQVDADSPLAGLDGWLSGAVTRDGGQANCGASPLTPGGRIAMVQWVTPEVDHDVSCSAGVSGTRPSISGIAVPGAVLAATADGWGPSGVQLTVQWLRDGVPVAGATGSTFSPTDADIGARLAVRVTGARQGAPALSLTSDDVTVSAAVQPAPVPTPTPPAAQTAQPVPTAAAPTASAPVPAPGEAAPARPGAAAPAAPTASPGVPAPAPSAAAPSVPESGSAATSQQRLLAV